MSLIRHNFFSLEKRVYFWPILLMGIVSILSSVSVIATPDIGNFFAFDKLAHFLVFGLIATSLLRIPYFYEKELGGVFEVIFIVACYGALDEYRQSFTLSRAVELNDWIADFAGAIVASLLYLRWYHYRRILEFKINLFG